MPALDTSGKALSFFEFWPTWLMYFPVVIQWLLLSVRHGSVTLPLLANPKLPLAGMAGVPKSTLFAQAEGECEAAILPWFTHTVGAQDCAQQAQTLLQLIERKGLQLPVVCKPDIGCRGAGVKLIDNAGDLARCLSAYPAGTSLIIQKLSRWEPEAGLFFIRHPQQPQGTIVSLALKYTPYVVGDGEHTLAQLIEQDTRAGKLSHLYKERHRDRLSDVIEKGKPYKLVFSASHCRGAIFRDAREFITPALTRRINQIMQGLPEFYYGRMDIKFPDIEQLQLGQGLEIVEINTASSESLHIWDRNTSLREAVGALLFQYRTLFQLGSQNRKRGFKTPGIRAFLKGWQAERRLHGFYPATD
ncbi:D-alanine--D-alanine ligase [Exilibacterium tricleocarpae]|uniref:D-alanine--D-alanine ligase n=2 Tax=Exilibacterium tricleocarpae TaxID=2591008 RepID=A0A545T6D0_9GAMM|nr:D-alanine--D-alanine ligase [Exilibacterium tricleocarpae]